MARSALSEFLFEIAQSRTCCRANGEAEYLGFDVGRVDDDALVVADGDDVHRADVVCDQRVTHDRILKASKVVVDEKYVLFEDDS